MSDTSDRLIKVENVTMEYRIAGHPVNGLKDYLVSTLKGQMNYRLLKALDGVSFSVDGGEIVGIIGTNGSGKSTLLRILAGIINPTSGEVDVDFGRVRLLTPEIGFDSELTGRENVYLNGSLIGYTGEFLDRNYDAIVDFAELHGFMDEKVKNYSDGMKLRLVFAIATAEISSGILLVDELLAVGDAFFKRKCLDRIRQLIGNGATVVMVSHDIASVRENCTRAIWIENGILKMDGDPGEVGDAFLRSGEGNE